MSVAASSDSYIRELIDARKRPAVLKIRLLNCRSRYPIGKLVVVEGDDDKIVYSYWIARTSTRFSFEFFVCGGKRSLRQLRNMLHEDKAETDKDLIFFVDRDFDDLDGFASGDRIFMLDQYSIENYLVACDVLDASIKCAYPGTGDPGTRNKICQIFESDYSRFLVLSKDINYRIFIARRLGIDIDKLIPNSLVSIVSVALGAVSASGRSPKEILPFPVEPGADDLVRLKAQFETLDPQSRYRGKFAFKFFLTWLERLAEEYRNAKIGMFPPPESVDGKIKHEELSRGALASRSALPCGFEEFLTQASA